MRGGSHACSHVCRDPRRRDARGERRVSGGERPREAEESIGIGAFEAHEPLLYHGEFRGRMRLAEAVTTSGAEALPLKLCWALLYE